MEQSYYTIGFKPLAKSPKNHFEVTSRQLLPGKTCSNIASGKDLLECSAVEHPRSRPGGRGEEEKKNTDFLNISLRKCKRGIMFPARCSFGLTVRRSVFPSGERST